jgi:hypothetical protein
MNIKRKHREPYEAKPYQDLFYRENRARVKHVSYVELGEFKRHRMRYIGDYFVSHTLKGKARVCRVVYSDPWEEKNGKVGCKACFFRHTQACVNHACLEVHRPYDWKSVHFKPLGDLVRMNYDDYED